jgi:hypothetical protein
MGKKQHQQDKLYLTTTVNFLLNISFIFYLSFRNGKTPSVVLKVQQKPMLIFVVYHSVVVVSHFNLLKILIVHLMASSLISHRSFHFLKNSVRKKKPTTIIILFSFPNQVVILSQVKNLKLNN